MALCRTGIDTKRPRRDARLGLSGACGGVVPLVPDRSVFPMEVAMRSVALLRRPGAAVLTCCVAITTVLALAAGGATELDPTLGTVAIQPVTVP